jgi:hypothetical protein
MNEGEPARIDSAAGQRMEHECIIGIDRIGERNFHRPTLPFSAVALVV